MCLHVDMLASLRCVCVPRNSACVYLCVRVFLLCEGARTPYAPNPSGPTALSACTATVYPFKTTRFKAVAEIRQLRLTLTWYTTAVYSFNPFRTAVPIWTQTSQILNTLSPKRDCGPKRVKTIRFKALELRGDHSK